MEEKELKKDSKKEDKISKKEEKEIKKEDAKKKITTVEELPGVGAATAEKLSLSGFNTLMSIAVASPGELVETTGMGENVAKRIIAVARSNLEMGFESGDELLKRRASVIKLSCGSKAFDTLLGGGFETGAITEAFGEYGSGKTQIGHALAVSVLKRFPDSTVIYIDTESTFRPERIVELSKGAGVDPDDILKRIKVARAFNSDHQTLLAEKVDDMVKNGENILLVVVDSLTSHFRAEFIGRGTLAERQQKINGHMRTLLKLATNNNICVFVTNQVMARPDVFFGDPTQAIGGHIVAHASTFRLYLRKGKKGTRVAKLVDSPNLPEGECSFIVETDGIKDI
jgi:DNA repair protein RadA